MYSTLIVVGENVEPLEIEEAAMRSSLIQQIVVIGQVLVRDFDLRTRYMFYLFTFSDLIALLRINAALELLLSLTKKR